MIWLVWGLSLGCVNSPPKPALSIEPPPQTTQAVPAESNQTDADCMKRCLQQNMARATAIEVIKADCAQGCSATTKEDGGVPELLPDL